MGTIGGQNFTCLVRVVLKFEQPLSLVKGFFFLPKRQKWQNIAWFSYLNHMCSFSHFAWKLRLSLDVFATSGFVLPSLSAYSTLKSSWSLSFSFFISFAAKIAGDFPLRHFVKRSQKVCTSCHKISQAWSLAIMQIFGVWTKPGPRPMGQPMGYPMGYLMGYPMGYPVGHPQN